MKADAEWAALEAKTAGKDPLCKAGSLIWPFTLALLLP